jgi:tetratricopeptide (TPR) repeat protein
MKTAATALIQLGKIPQAEAILEKRIRLTPYRHPEYYRELGDLLWQRHKIEAARKVYRQGLNAFPPEVIPRYERYTPSHRYELFMLYQHAAHLANSQKNTSDAKKLEVQAQDLLKTATADLFVTSGFNAPVTALKNYWLNLGKKQQQLSLQTEDPLPPPPSELKFDPSQLLFLQARRDIFSAELVYLIPIRSPGDSHWHPLILKDYLQGFPDGWKIIRREPVKANTSEP